MHAGELLFCYCEMRIDCEREDASVCESAMQRERGDIFVVAERRSATIVDIIADARLRTMRMSSDRQRERRGEGSLRLLSRPL